jgi:protein-arginine kinase activator protein McsA
MTECQECRRDAGREVRVRYTNGRTEQLDLCESCAKEYENGELVSEID